MIKTTAKKNNRFSFQISKWVLIVFALIALLHKFIANDIPVLARSNQGIVSPVINDYLYDLGWVDANPHLKKDQYKSIVNPLVNTSPYRTNVTRIYATPGDAAHFLGTDSVGRDVLAGLVYGAATAMKVSLFGVLIALVLGVLIGLISGYYLNQPPRIDILHSIILIILILIVSAYLTIELSSGATSWGFIIIITIGLWICSLFTLKYIPEFTHKKWTLPIATITDRIIEVREAIPSIFLVLGAIALFAESSIWNIVLIIGFISWSNISRYMRAEVLKIRSNHYIDAARVQGLSTFRIMVRHILPNAIDPILAVVTFSLTTAILLEATLSFLGIGMPPQQPTWGGMLAQAREANIWWLALFPGMCIFIIITCLNVLADNIQQRLDRRM